jgi:hypothetical protein
VPPLKALLTIVLAGCFVSYAAIAHHSYAPYDDSQIVEVEGTLLRVAWQNPHVHLTIEIVDTNQRPATWEIETVGLNQLQRLQVPLDAYAAGQRVKVAGWPARRALGPRMYATNLLSADGREVVLWRTSALRWTTTGFGYTDRTQFGGGGASDTDTLFRVWTSDYDDPDAGPASLFGRTQLPFNDAGRTAAAQFDPVADTATVGCTPKGMPQIMAQPMPMEIIDRGDTILIRLEEYDTLRSIGMTAAATPELRPSRLGHSVGRWEGKTLAVITTRLTAQYLSQRGQPLSDTAWLRERFTVAEDGSRLNYVLTVTDPVYYTTPFEVRRSWVWRPNERVMPFNCAL